MKKRLTPHRFLLAVAILASLTYFTTDTMCQSARTKLPSGNWTLSAGPYSGPGYEAAPVDVYSVMTEADKGLMVTRVALSNSSSKDVTAVKLHWYLIDKEQGTVLKEGKTPLVDVDIPAGKTEFLSYPVISFSRLYKSLMKGAGLSGNYRIEVAVGEVVYAEGSAHVRSRAGHVSYRKAAHLRTTTIVDCQDQGCRYNATEGIRSYQCTSNHGTLCSVTLAGRACTETRCGGERPPVE